MAQQTIGIGGAVNDGTGDPARTAGGKINANFTELYGKTALIIKPDVSPSNSAATNSTNIAAAITAANAAGGGIVQFLGFSSRIPIASPIVPQANVILVGAGYVVDQSTYRVTTGTVFQGDGTFAGISYQPTDSGSAYANATAYLNSMVQNFGAKDLAFDTVTSAIRAGAQNQGSFNTCGFRNIAVSNFSDWGFFIENFSHCDFTRLQTFSCTSAANGKMWFGASLGTVYNPGNSRFDGCVASGIPGNVPTRNIVVIARTANSKLNNVTFVDCGGSTSAARVIQTATMSSGSANITVTDGTQFKVDWPVTFADTGDTSATALINGFQPYKTYFVTSVAGNVITVSQYPGSTNQTATGNTAIKMVTYGPFMLEVQGRDSGCIIQTPSFYSADLEGICGAACFAQQIEGGYFNFAYLGQIQFSSPMSNATCASHFVGRGYVKGNLFTAQPMTFDFDNNVPAYGQLIVNASVNDSATKLPYVNVLSGASLQFRPAGFMYDVVAKGYGLNLSRFPAWTFAQGAEVFDLRGIAPTSGGALLYPHATMMQRATQYGSAGNYNLNAAQSGGSHTWYGTAAATATLQSCPNQQGGFTDSSGGDGVTGTPFEITNRSSNGSLLTVAAFSGQTFGDSTVTSYVIPYGKTLALRIQYDGTAAFASVINADGCLPNADPDQQLVTTGSSVTVAKQVKTLVIDTGTSSPFTANVTTVGDGQVFTVIPGIAVASFTFTPSTGTVKGGSAIALTANVAVSWKYRASNTTWYRSA